LAGFWPGGRVYGYRTVREENPPDPEHPRAIPLIDEVQAAVVRRIFQLYADTHGLKQIASILNDERVPAPYDDAYRKQGGRGWGPGTIRFMLKNERYIGRSVWNKRMWVTDPATGARTYRMRGQDEWITTEQPSLAIIPKDLWERVQARFAERKGAKGRARGTGRTGHLLTGLLRCGECGSTMRVVGVKRKAGRAYANFGCSAHHGKGAAICANGLVITERKLNRAVIDELRKLLASREIQARFIDGFTRRLRNRNPADDRERAALEAEVKTQETRVRNITAAIAKSGYSEALGEQLGLEEETLRSLRQRLSAKKPAGDQAAPIPDPEAVARFLEKILDIAETAPQRARASLARILVPITLVPGTRREREAALRSPRRLEHEPGRPLGRPGVCLWWLRGRDEGVLSYGQSPAHAQNQLGPRLLVPRLRPPSPWRRVMRRPSSAATARGAPDAASPSSPQASGA
ncbi:MAG TPA: recombinase family protein, partial [Anaeromyxobacteraceae bacterium]|nr:recombinase family protein [Anaeromyxobacteraceae bacterium]